MYPYHTFVIIHGMIKYNWAKEDANENYKTIVLWLFSGSNWFDEPKSGRNSL